MDAGFTAVQRLDSSQALQGLGVAVI